MQNASRLKSAMKLNFDVPPIKPANVPPISAKLEPLPTNKFKSRKRKRLVETSGKINQQIISL